MKYALIFLFLPALSCVNHSDQHVQENDIFLEDSEMKSEVKYAQGFELKYGNGYTQVVTKSIDGNDSFQDTVQLNFKKNTTSATKQINSSLTSVNCQSSTHLAYLNALGVLNTVSGHCGIQFISNPTVINEFNKNEVSEICLNESISVEPLLTTNPELFFAYPFSKEEVEDLKSKGVKSFYIAEYLEKSPLARLEWIKLFGVLYQKEKLASDFFDRAEQEYLAFKKDEINLEQDFIFNLPYGDNWYTPSANSLVVKLCEDAGFSYFYQNEKGTENMLHTTEQVWLDGTQANYWIIIADRPAEFSLEDLVAEEEVYSTFKSVKNKKVIFCSSADTDYFFSGVIEPEILLKDLINITEPIDGYQPKYFRLLN